MRWWMPWALVGALGGVLSLELLLIVPHFGLAALVGAGAWMILPGILLARRLFARVDPSGIAAWLIGPALGLGLSVFGVFLIWVSGLQNWLALLLGPALTWLIVWMAGRFGGPTVRLPSFDRRDVLAMTLALLIVPVVTWAPYRHIRAPVADGEAYRAYFTADFVWAMTVTSELAKGDVPPHNPFLRDQDLHYYWMAHFLSGSLYRNVQAWGMRSEQVILANGVLFGVTFVAFVYGLARLAGAGPWASLVAVAAGFLANSYEGADMIRVILTRDQSWTELANVNVDAVTRWFYKGMPVDGLQRLLLYQPHHLTGYMLALSALWLVGLAEDVSETSVALLAGILLALTLIFSTFSALIVGGAVGLLFALRIAQQRVWRSTLQSAILGAVPVAVGVAVTNALGYTDRRYGFLLHFGANPVAFEHLGRVLLLNFGPLLFAGIAGLARWRWALTTGAPAAALVIASLGFYFFTNVPDSGDVWVGWRSGHMLLVAFAVMGAAALSAAWRFQQFRVVLAATVTVAVLLGVPTVAVDVYNAQDVTNRSQGPDFPWTLVITPDEREALDWIRRSTPPDAIVQVEPYIRGNKHWSFIPAFAERRSVAALPVSMIPMRPYREAADDLYWGVYRARTADEAHVFARYLGINFLAVGRVERRAYASGIAQIAARPELFAPVYRNPEITIFRVEP